MKRWEVIERLVKVNGWTSGAEIGVWTGDTFFYLLTHCPRLKLTGVDNWMHYSTYPEKKHKAAGVGEYWPIEKTLAVGEEVRNRAKGYGNARILYMDSIEAVECVEDDSLDFVFIDADHTTAGVLLDIRLWTPKVRAGGYVMGHDEDWPSVRKALALTYHEWVKAENNVWYVPKK